MDILKNEHNGIPENGCGLIVRPALAAHEESHPACHSFFWRLSRRGQQIVEYGLLISALSMALLAMYVYTKRGLQSTIKDLTDYHLGPQIDSRPILATGAHQGSNSIVSTRSQEEWNIKKDPLFGAQYEYTTGSYSSGESEAVFNDF